MFFYWQIGNLLYFSLEKWEVCVSYRHNMGITKIFTDCEGTKLIFIDNHSQGFVFLPALEEAIIIADFPKMCELCLWDWAQQNHFITYNDKIATTYVFVRYSIYGKHTIKIGETKLNSSQMPLIVCDGEMVLHIDGGQYSTQTLVTHLILPGSSHSSNLKNLLLLRKYTEAFKICEKINLKGSYMDLAQQALSDLEPAIGIITNVEYIFVW